MLSGSKPKLDASFAEMAEHYCSLTGEPFVSPNALFIKGRGFLTVKLDQFHRLWVEQLYGDIKYWEHVYFGIARELGCEKVMFCTADRERAYQKLYDAKKVVTVMEVDPWAQSLAPPSAWAQASSAERALSQPSETHKTVASLHSIPNSDDSPQVVLDWTKTLTSVAPPHSKTSSPTPPQQPSSRHLRIVRPERETS